MIVVTTITKTQFYQAAGLLALAHHHKKIVDECEDALRKLLEPDDKDGFGHSGDAIWQDATIETLLAKIGIMVEPDGA